MSSATSTEESAPSAGSADQGLQPWQFFLLAGMLSATAVVLLVAGQSPASIIVLSLTVVAASFVALGTYRSLAPLVVPGGVEAPPLIVGRTRAALDREKTLALRSIKELEFDYAMKKIAPADFEELSARLRARALSLMRQLDEAGGYRADIEREVAQRLGARASGAGATGATGATGAAGAGAAEADGLQATETTPYEGPGVGAGLERHLRCQCGTVNDADARFCKTCGNKLAAA